MNIDVMYMSEKMDWTTPQDFFERLDDEFHFTLDPCADDLNHKCKKYFTVETDGLKQDWGGNVHSLIHLTEQPLVSGLKKLFEKGIKITPLLFC